MGVEIPQQSVNDLNSVFRRHPNIVPRSLGDELVLVPMRQDEGRPERLCALNDVGAFIWKLLDGERTSADVARVVAEEFKASPQDVQNDLMEFLGSLMAAGAIDPVA